MKPETKGHIEKKGRKSVYCTTCKLLKPKSGWINDCALASK